MTTTKQTPSRIAFKSDTRENWAKAKNFIPLKGEPIHYSDINKIKIGDGATNVRNLPFADSLPPSEGIAYELSDDETYAICTGRDGFTGTLLVIASEYKNKPVTHIGESAFADLDHRFPALINVVLPNTITHIGNYAFQGCGIQEINIPNSVIYIDDGAFIQNSLVSITIPDSVISIGFEAFYFCYSLTSIEIPDSVTSIGSYAFAWCFRLTNITIPNSVTNIGEHVFSECTNLIIYCEAESKPEGWNDSWNCDNRPVVWGYASDIPGVNEKISQTNIAIETLREELGDIESALDAILAIQEELINGGGEEEELITFTYMDSEGDIFTFNAVNGQTWGEWCESEYNTIGAFVNSEQGNAIYVDDIAQIRRYWHEDDQRYEDCYDITPIIANATYQRHG